MILMITDIEIENVMMSIRVENAVSLEDIGTENVIHVLAMWLLISAISLLL